MRTGRHENQDVLAPFETLDVLKIGTSLYYHIHHLNFLRIATP